MPRQDPWTYKPYVNKHEAAHDPYKPTTSELKCRYCWNKRPDGLIEKLNGEGTIVAVYRVATKAEVTNTTRTTWHYTEEPCPINKNEYLVEVKQTVGTS